jgi:hypothetical protein
MGLPLTELLDDMGIDAASRPSWTCPFENACILDEAACIKLTGNGMHMAVAGAVIGWSLGHLVPKKAIGMDPGGLSWMFNLVDHDELDEESSTHGRSSSSSTQVDILPSGTFRRLSRKSSSK